MDRKGLGFVVAVAVMMLVPFDAGAFQTYFATNCQTCHSDDTVSCIGCHHHGQPQVALTDLTEYQPGSTVTVTLGGAVSSGWARAILYNQNNQEVDRVSGPTGNGDNGTSTSLYSYPFALKGTAPLAGGTYTWQAAWWGSPYDTGNPVAFPHGPEVRIATTFTVVGTTPPPVDAADISVRPVSPRERDQSTTDILDMTATGLDVVGVNKRVFLAPVPHADAVTSITNYVWSISSEPSAGAAVIDSNTSSMLKFHPSVAGTYEARLVPMLGAAAGLPVTQRIYAAKFVGTGTEGGNTPAAPMCGVAFCHGNSASGRLNKVTEWNGSRHAHMLESFLQGQRGSFYSASCLACHTLGYDTVTTGNDNFREMASRTGFNLSQIPTWVAQAATTGILHWNDLPTTLQLKSNIQCEACHGPGSGHNGDKTKIVGARYDADSCRQCHDAPTHHMRFVQYDASHHAQSHTDDRGNRSTCQPCHAGEGFIFLKVEGQASIPANVTTRGPVNCVSCHDPHSDANEHQLRTTATVTLPNGALYSGGLGNLCANCHNSRITTPTTTINTSSRGSHYGPQADIMLGQSAYDWGRPYPVGAGIHKAVVSDTCVHCHMAETPESNPSAPVGDHTWTIDAGTTSNVANACGGCHPGLTTTDRLPFPPVDYNGDGYTSGVQTEVAGLLAIVRDEILDRAQGTTWDSGHNRISISSSRYPSLTFNMKAALYNFNLCSSEGSRGIHNARYVVAVLQRSYYFATDQLFSQAYPQATLVDNYTAVHPTQWRLYR